MTEDDTPKKNPFERIEPPYERYYTIDSTGCVIDYSDTYSDFDDGCFNVANYCTDEDLLRYRALHETLNRLLWRFSMENGENKNPWDGKHEHYHMCNYRGDDSVQIWAVTNSNSVGTIYFPSQEITQCAIDEIVEPFMKEHPDFVW